jgi:ferrochelatase
VRQVVLLLAHGAPERLEDIEPYLTLVRGGKPPTPHIVQEMKRRYAAIGGGSPLEARTRQQALALESRLASDGFPARVYVAMRHWRPSIRETLARMQADGADRIVALYLAPQYSASSAGLYLRQIEEANRELGFKAGIVWTKSLYSHPLLIEAFHEKLAPLLPRQRVLFTAHSLPQKALKEGDSYGREAKATARLIAERARLDNWDFAFHSQGMTDEPWLGPTVEFVLDRYAQQGLGEVVLAPIGFVCDHVEILYDVDIQLRQYARERGIRLERPESLNDSPTFIAAVAAVIRERLEAT